jgi:aspartyl-tRNA(Asn)/glutamyl-tRNA(Gln) amidotransferase subunit B
MVLGIIGQHKNLLKVHSFDSSMDKLMIGLEIHGYIETDEKLFCNCMNFHDMKKIKPNVNVCPVCTGQPGSKPMLPNKSALDKAIEIALILGCKVSENLLFQRKHYSWPDMPTGYQKTISGAHSDFVGVNGNFLGIRIAEVHLEEDPGAWNPETGKVDYNRAGSPLIEIVTEPDFVESLEVGSWLKQMVLTLSYIKALSKDAGIKADVNVNIKGVSERAEVKNVNSITEIQKVIEAEFERHKKEKPKVMETRRWLPLEGYTELMRSKENSQDYRFIPDPDLPVIKIDNKRVRDLQKSLPETPMKKLDKIIKKYKIDKKSAEILIGNLEIAELYEDVIKKVDAKFALPWIVTEWFSVLNYNKKTMVDVEVNSEHFVELLKLLKDGKITPLKAKEIMRKFIPKSYSPKKEAAEGGKMGDEGELKEIIGKILKDNKKSVDDYESGNKNALNFLIGQVMHKTNKRADYQVVRKLLSDKLS